MLSDFKYSELLNLISLHGDLPYSRLPFAFWVEGSRNRVKFEFSHDNQVLEGTIYKMVEGKPLVPGAAVDPEIRAMIKWLMPKG